MLRIGVVGAGAIGRGFVPWLFRSQEASFFFVENNVSILQVLKRDTFTTFRSSKRGYESISVSVGGVVQSAKELPGDCDFYIVAAGTRVFPEIVESFAPVSAPILSLENDRSIVQAASRARPDLEIFFGIPDVIASPTAPGPLLQEDPAACVTEVGTCYIPEILGGTIPWGPDIVFASEEAMHEQWMAKLFLHNTPHCIAAYLGSLSGKTFLHEGFENPKLSKVVEASVSEMTEMLGRKHGLDSSFLESYGRKELERFKDRLLFDPIARVAREPFRKLAPRERLVGAAELALSVGVVPRAIQTGILAAFLYDRADDADWHLRFLREGLDPAAFLEIVLGLSPASALFGSLLDDWHGNMDFLANLDAE